MVIYVPPDAGDVYERPGDPSRRVVVLTGTAYNRLTRRPIVCPLVLAEATVDVPDADELRTLAPSPGFIAYPLRFWIPENALAAPVGAVETAPLRRALMVVRHGYGHID